MSDKEYIDFKKEFEDFKKELEDSEPLFDDELDFTDFDDYKIVSDSMESDMADYPNLTLEDENILLNLIIKKDYSKTDDVNERKEELIHDLKDFIDEFSQTNEFNELLAYYDGKTE